MIATPDSHFLYASDFQSDQVDAFSIDGHTEALTAVLGSPYRFGNLTRSAGGLGMDAAGRFLYATDIQAFQVPGFTINGSNGSLTAVPGSPFTTGFYPGRTVVSPSTKFVEVVDLGLGLGGISSFTINTSNGFLTPGPSGPLTFVSSAGAADMVMHSSGKFLCISQGFTAIDSGVAAFTLDQTTGFPTQIGGTFLAGLAPRRMVADPATKFLYTANTGDGTVSAFSIDSMTGALTPVMGSPFPTGISAPPAGALILFDLAIDPLGQFLYVSNPQTNSIAWFRISATTGTLSPLGATPLTGSGPGAMVAVKLQ